MSRNQSERTIPQFNVARATQIVGAFLERLGGTAYYILLVKLVYLTEREALLRWGRPLTFDKLCSMKNGTVASETLNLLKGDRHSSYWSKFVSEPHAKQVKLRKAPEADELSPMEIDLIQEVFEQYGHWDRFALARFTHTLPEYTETTSSIPIAYQEILKGGKIDGDDIASIMSEIDGLVLLEDIR